MPARTARTRKPATTSAPAPDLSAIMDTLAALTATVATLTDAPAPAKPARNAKPKPEPKPERVPSIIRWHKPVRVKAGETFPHTLRNGTDATYKRLTLDEATAALAAVYEAGGFYAQRVA